MRFKYIITAIVLTILFPIVTLAQSSSMTDEQVMTFVVQEQKAGTSQSQIVTKLMQRGVDISQIRRIRQKYERQNKEGGLGNVSDPTLDNQQTRLRKANGEKKTNEKNYSDSRIKDTNATHTYDENDNEYQLMQDELNNIAPDSTEIKRQKWERAYELNHQKQVFGRNIFNRTDLSFEPSMNIATPQNYVLGPGDAVIVDVYGASQKTFNTTVSPDGEITIEGFGPIQVSGLSVSQANAKIRSQLGARYSSSRVKLTVGQTRTIMVNVMGEVKTPGTYTLSAFATVFNALYMAGGTNDLGTLRNIKVFRHNKLVAVADVYDYILNGKTGNIRLADNDVIYVGSYDCLVNITGKVKRPMYYEMKPSESVGTLIKYAGGFTGDAYKKAVRIMRKTGREHSVFNIEEFDMSSFHIADGDSVSVDSILNRYANTVEIKGAVFRPGMYQLGGDITTVRSLIQHAEGLTEDAFTARAVMHRMKDDRQLEVISLDINGIMSGKATDVPLKENDVLFIPTKQDAQVERTITIHGEVQYPGIYKYADNETIEDFILQAGGLKETASTAKIDVARRINDMKALKADSIIAQTYTMSLKDGFVVDGQPGFTLMPFDEVYVRKSPGYYTQQNITIDGEVMFAGTYTLAKKNQRLSDVIKAAGGVNDRAYVEGARLERQYNAEERKNAEDALKKARMDLENSLLEQVAKSGNTNLTKIDTEQQLKNFQVGATYPIGIELDKALANPGGPEDMVLREGDRITVPEYDATVKIQGEVMFPNTVGYMAGKSINYYIDQAGGFSSKAKKSQTYIRYMNGTVAKIGHNAKPTPGCEIIVPSKTITRTSLQETLSIATSVGSFAAIIATLANILK
jgi:protein involved in polysaccharide export with SLBB domain